MQTTQHRREELSQPLPASCATAPSRSFPGRRHPGTRACGDAPAAGYLVLRAAPKEGRAPPLCARWCSDRLQCPISMVPA